VKLATYDVPAGGDHVSLGTVRGFPLEPGERVVFYVAPDHSRTKTRLVLFGVLLAVVVFGLFLIYYGLKYERWGLRFVAVTNTRIIVGRGDRPARAMPLAAITALRAEPELPGSDKSGVSNAGADKTDARYWAAADALALDTKEGAVVIDKSADLAHLGPVIANALYTKGYFDRVPTVHCPP